MDKVIRVQLSRIIATLIAQVDPKIYENTSYIKILYKFYIRVW